MADSNYNLQLLAQVATEGDAGAGEERSPPLQRPYCGTHAGVAKKKPRSFPEKRSVNKKRRVSPPASSPTTASTSDVHKLVKSSSPCGNTELLRPWGGSKKRSRRIYSNSAAGGAERAADHQPLPPPAAPQAGRTWRDVHREMGGGKVVWIGKKTVHMSDKSKQQSRLLLPRGLEKQLYKHVDEGEKEKINSDAGLRVEVLGYYGVRFVMTCKYRKCQKGLVFNSGWTAFLNRHEATHLREGESLLLLAFRSQQQRLCFVFIPQHLEDEDQHQHDR